MGYHRVHHDDDNSCLIDDKNAYVNGVFYTTDTRWSDMTEPAHDQLDSDNEEAHVHFDSYGNDDDTRRHAQSSDMSTSKYFGFSSINEVIDVLNELHSSFGASDSDTTREINWDALSGIMEPQSRGKKRSGERLRDRLARERDELAVAIGVLSRKLARREEQLTHFARYPSDDVFTDGDVLRFAKKFPNSEQRYTYVAVKVDGTWHLTGKRSPQGITWDVLVDFMGLGVDEVYHMNAREHTERGVQSVERKIIG